MKLTKNKVLVTGATSGIGLEMTTRWLALGNEVLAVGRDWEKLAAMASEYDNLTVYPCDLGDRDALLQLAGRIRADHPDLNLLVNHAGIPFHHRSDTRQSAADRIADEIDVNLRAAILLTEQLLPVLLDQPSAAVVNISSGYGDEPQRAHAVHCATRAGLHAFSQALRSQLEDSGVKVFELIPPPVDTVGSKTSVADMVSIFMGNFRKDYQEISLGNVNMLRTLLRIWPGMGQRILKNA
jgi:short-subunit dehydrogenase involved in D-alanine esterification of teichoic acids